MTKPLSCLERHVLLLNANYVALRVVTVRKAFTLLFKRDPFYNPVAEIVCVESDRYVSYAFDEWAELSLMTYRFDGADEEWIRTVRFNLMVPRIVRVLSYGRIPRRDVRFSRRSILARDRNTCQYCGAVFGSSELTLDHVVPRSQGGLTTWINVVCACRRCNVRKGGRTPAQAGFHLKDRPVKPSYNPVVCFDVGEQRYASWRPFIEQAKWDIRSA